MNKLKKFLVIIALAFVSIGLTCFPVVKYASAEEPTTEEEVVSENEDSDSENSVEDNEDSEENYTFEQFLETTQKVADQYGYGDEYAQAIESIKTAVTTKQVTISTLASVVMAVVCLIGIIKSKFRDKSVYTDLQKVKEQLTTLTDGTNGLIDGTNENSQVSEDLKSSSEATQKAVKYLTAAFRLFIERVKLPDETKENILNNCDKATNEVEDDNNKK